MLFLIGSWILYIYNEYFKRRGVEPEDDVMTLTQIIKRYATASLCFSVKRGESDIVKTTTCHNTAGWLQRCVQQTGNRQLCVVDPKVHIDLTDWTSYIDQQDYPELPSGIEKGKFYLLFKALTDQHDEDLLLNSVNLVKVTDHMTPLAWKSGDTFCILGECDVKGLTNLAAAFMQNNLVLPEASLALDEMLTVSVEGHAVKLLRVDSSASEPFKAQSPLKRYTPREENSHCFIREELSPNSEANNMKPKFSISTDELDNIAPEQAEHQSLIDRLATLGQQFVHSAGDLGVDSEGAGEALSPCEEIHTAFRTGDSEASNSPLRRPGSTLEGAGEALSPEIDDLSLLDDFGKHAENTKPPNVLVYCGKKDSQRLFEKVKSTFVLCFNPDKYILYNLKHELIFSAPWVENTACLVVASDKVYDDIEKQFLKYFLEGGIVCSFTNNVDLLFCDRHPQEHFTGILKLSYKPWTNITVACGKYTYGKGPFECKLKDVDLTPLAQDSFGNVVILAAYHNTSGGKAILSQCNLDKDPTELAITPDVYDLLKQANASRFAILRHLLGHVGVDSSAGKTPQLTPCFVLASSQLQRNLTDKLKPRLQEGTLTGRQGNLQFVQSILEIKHPVVKETLPVVMETKEIPGFNHDEYFEDLKTKVLGNTVLYTDVITSTMPLIDALMSFAPDNVGLIAIAKQQTIGKGRGGNAWLSPVGCAMFSLHVTLTLDTELGSKLSYLQHIASLAVVEAVTSLPGYEELDLRLKWPNDLYYGESIKIGGVLIKSSVMGNVIHANIGVGVNVTNTNPTMCINDAIRRHNLNNNTDLFDLSTESLIALSVTRLEKLVNLFQTEGYHGFLKRYYKRWIHSGKSVQLESESGPMAEIQGLDEYGYLLVKLQDGGNHSVHPDGNSFDITKNLILPKERT